MKNITITSDEVLNELLRLSKPGRNDPGFSTEEIADKLHVSECTVRRMIRTAQKMGVKITVGRRMTQTISGYLKPTPVYTFKR
jgi:predicted DNA-binding transcriptional regulator YafY